MSSHSIARMDETEFHTQLKAHRLSIRDGCILIYAHTGVALDARELRTYLARHGRLSRRDTIIWGLLFSIVKKKGKPQ
jgi:hypothetical protein